MRWRWHEEVLRPGSREFYWCRRFDVLRLFFAIERDGGRFFKRLAVRLFDDDCDGIRILELRKGHFGFGIHRFST